MSSLWILVYLFVLKFLVFPFKNLLFSSRSPPVALQPSLGHYYESINQEWRKGYEVQTTQTGHYVSGPKLSRVVVVSISGGYNDYQACLQLFL